MESVMSSFRLFMATSIGARQPQSVQGNLNLCRATSICAKQPQSVQNNLNSCKTTSIRAEKKNPKSNGLFQEAKTNFRTRNFFSGQGIYIKNTFRKKNGGKASNLASAVAETVCPPCIRGRHPQLDYLTRPKKSSWATNYFLRCLTLHLYNRVVSSTITNFKHERRPFQTENYADALAGEFLIWY